MLTDGQQVLNQCQLALHQAALYADGTPPGVLFHDPAQRNIWPVNQLRSANPTCSQRRAKGKTKSIEVGNEAIKADQQGAAQRTSFDLQGQRQRHLSISLLTDYAA